MLNFTWSTEILFPGNQPLLRERISFNIQKLDFFQNNLVIHICLLRTSFEYLKTPFCSQLIFLSRKAFFHSVNCGFRHRGSFFGFIIMRHVFGYKFCKFSSDNKETNKMLWLYASFSKISLSIKLSIKLCRMLIKMEFLEIFENDRKGQSLSHFRRFCGKKFFLSNLYSQEKYFSEKFATKIWKIYKSFAD